METEYSSLGRTHIRVLDEPSDAAVLLTNDESLMDYTTAPVDWSIQGNLSTGHVTKSTMRCQCGRVGVLAMRNNDHRIVHRGRVSANILHAVEYCELLIAAH